MSKNFNIPKQVIYVCTGSKCKRKGGKDLSRTFRDLAKQNGLRDDVEIIRTECTDRCDFAPVLSFQPQNIWLHKVSEFQGRQLFQEHILNYPQKQNPSDPEV